MDLRLGTVVDDGGVPGLRRVKRRWADQYGSQWTGRGPPERFRAAADNLVRTYPVDEVVTYFLTVLLQDFESWKPAIQWLESVGDA